MTEPYVSDGVFKKFRLFSKNTRVLIAAILVVWVWGLLLYLLTFTELALWVRGAISSIPPILLACILGAHFRNRR